jgi:hypothetical protein
MVELLQQILKDIGLADREFLHIDEDLIEASSYKIKKTMEAKSLLTKR